ncbi:MAG: FAD-binding oxidoreductase [Bacilli bacterium]
MEESFQVPDQRMLDVLMSCVGSDHVRVHSQLAARISGQREPVVSVFPGAADEVSSVLKLAGENGWKVTPVGAGTQLGFGNIAQPIAVAVHTERLCQVVDYSPADMVVTVQSGMRFTDLQQLLAKHGQMLGIDPVCSPLATVGGLVATGSSGPARVLYGTLRDMLIGTRIAFADGNLVRTGGKVVKNVAGYDLSKLFIGSLGTLGILTECTFKLKPLPPHRELCLLGGSTAQVDALRKQVMDANLIPSSLELLATERAKDAAGDRSVQWLLAVGCDEGERAAAFQTKSLEQMASAAGASFTVLRQAEVLQFWERYRRTLAPSGFVLRIQAPPTQLVTLAADIDASAAARNVRLFHSFSLSSGTGRVFASIPDDPAAIIDFVGDVRRLCGERGGASVIEQAALEVRRRHDCFHSDRLGEGELAVMRLVKQAFDPRNLLTPMKFAGGI